MTPAKSQDAPLQNSEFSTTARSAKRYFKRYTTVVSVSAGSGVGSP